MTGLLLALALGVLLGGGGAAALLSFRPRLATRVGAAAAMAGGLLGLVPATHTLLAGIPQAWTLNWHSFMGLSVAVRLDPLGALFLLPVFGLGAVCALYASAYWRRHGHAAPGPAGLPWLWYNGLVASLAAVVVAGDMLGFLVAWETMTLTSCFLVTLDDASPATRRAGRLYLIASHLGTACLMAAFLLAASSAGDSRFEAWPSVMALWPTGLSICAALLALLGFGTKAGLMPLHIWLPEAHPAAPSPVSAVMSGVMIKMGVYGLVRWLTWNGLPPANWGVVLITLGVASGVLGVLFALAQSDFKRMLAYSSVENVGVITLGLGVGLVGWATDQGVVAVAGFAGAFVHMLSHACFKGLLFLGAGSVVQATGTRELDRLGGLLKAMPMTGTSMFLGSAAIAGLPPLNGFVGEFLILFGAFWGVVYGGPEAMPFALVAAIGGLALIGGLAVACFTRAFGLVFLGEPRDAQPPVAEAPPAMRLPLHLLAAVCVWMGLLAAYVPCVMGPVLGSFLPAHLLAGLEALAPILRALGNMAAAIWIGLLGVAFLRRRLLAGREVREHGTWDCGYARPTARMQYTATSFAQPLVDLFRPLLRSRRLVDPPEGLFPRAGSASTETRDLFRTRFFEPLYGEIDALMGRFRRLQHGRVQWYVAYIVLTLLLLLIVSMRAMP